MVAVFCRRSAFKTTEMDEKAMAVPATQGASKPMAAIGKYRRCLVCWSVSSFVFTLSVARNFMTEKIGL